MRFVVIRLGSIIGTVHVRDDNGHVYVAHCDGPLQIGELVVMGLDGRVRAVPPTPQPVPAEVPVCWVINVDQLVAKVCDCGALKVKDMTHYDWCSTRGGR